MRNTFTDIDLSPESFDALTGEHEFSDRYKEEKARMLDIFRNSGRRRRVLRIAAAVAAIMIVIPTAAVAATNGSLFDRIWGRGGREDIPAHTEGYYDDFNGSYVEFDVPATEYVDVSPEEAEAILGDTSVEPKVVNIGDTVMTVTSAVRSKSAAVVTYTLEREGGVDWLLYDESTNRDKGAYFAEDSEYYYHFGSASVTYVDLELSTPERVVCYEYIAHPSASITLTVVKRSTDGSDPSKEQLIDVGCCSRLESVDFLSADGGKVSLSAIGMRLDRIPAVSLDVDPEIYDPSSDPYSAYYVAIDFADGSRYIVEQHDYHDIFDCDPEIDNCAYVCGRLDGGIDYVFNRLVDVGEVVSVTVNQTVYNR